MKSLKFHVIQIYFLQGVNKRKYLNLIFEKVFQ